MEKRRHHPHHNPKNPNNLGACAFGGETRVPPKNKCCLCESPLNGKRHTEIRPTGVGPSYQKWHYCLKCKDLFL